MKRSTSVIAGFSSLRVHTERREKISRHKQLPTNIGAVTTRGPSSRKVLYTSDEPTLVTYQCFCELREFVNSPRLWDARI